MFEHLLQPGRIGNITTKNRIRFAPQITNMCEPDTGEVTEREINYLVEKAKGGAGIVTAQGGYVQPLGKGYPRQMAMDRDENIPGLTRLASAIKAHGPWPCPRSCMWEGWPTRNTPAWMNCP